MSSPRGDCRGSFSLRNRTSNSRESSSTAKELPGPQLGGFRPSSLIGAGVIRIAFACPVIPQPNLDGGFAQARRLSELLRLRSRSGQIESPRLSPTAESRCRIVNPELVIPASLACLAGASYHCPWKTDARGKAAMRVGWTCSEPSTPETISTPPHSPAVAGHEPRRKFGIQGSCVSRNGPRTQDHVGLPRTAKCSDSRSRHGSVARTAWATNGSRLTRHYRSCSRSARVVWHLKMSIHANAMPRSTSRSELSLFTPLRSTHAQH